MLSIDGGGSGTRAVVVDSRDRLLWSSEGGPGNCRTQPIDRVYAVLDTLYRNAVGAVGPLGGVGIGLAGAGDPEEAARHASRCVREWGLPENQVFMDSDLRLAHRAAFLDGAGIVLIAGTGSSCLGRSEEGEWHRCGGWGPVLDDTGSGYAVGLEALRCILRGSDGRNAVPPWGASLLEKLGLDRADGLVGWIHDRSDRRAEVASLCEIVVDHAEAGDGQAQSIRDGAVHSLCELVVATGTTLKMERPGVVIHGGLGARLRPLLEERLMGGCLKVRLVEPVHPPEWGGVVAVRSVLSGS